MLAKLRALLVSLGLITLSAMTANSRFSAGAMVLAGLLASSTADAADSGANGEEIEHTLIVGVGGAAEFELGERSFHPGANVMLEWEAVEDWLELEIGASVLAARTGTRLPIDVLFKKPFRVTRRFEFMLGVGPEVVHTWGATRGLHFGAEFALDFMFWPSERVGLWIEPSYDLVLDPGVSHGLGSTGGLLIGW